MIDERLVLGLVVLIRTLIGRRYLFNEFRVIVQEFRFVFLQRLTRIFQFVYNFLAEVMIFIFP